MGVNFPGICKRRFARDLGIKTGMELKEAVLL